MARETREGNQGMTVYFIGAGPGAADLLTIRGQKAIAACSVCIYAGSLVPEGILDHCPEGCEITNSANMALPDIVSLIQAAHNRGKDVARLHSGDPSLYSAVGEQVHALNGCNIPYDIIPGVPAYCASAAALGVELTLPGVSQSIVLTRTSKNSSAMPDSETLENFARTRSTLVLHLSAKAIGSICDRLVPYYGKDCPAAIVSRASWPDEQVIVAPLDRLADKCTAAGIARTATILVGPALSGSLSRTSSLYSPERAHQRNS